MRTRVAATAFLSKAKEGTPIRSQSHKRVLNHRRKHTKQRRLLKDVREAGSENEDENGMMGNASEDDVGLHDDVDDDVNDDEAARCRRALDDVGIDDVVRKWLARLVATRTIVAVPIADVAGLHADLVRYTCPAAGTSNAPISTGGATAATMAVLHRLAPPTRVQLWISRSHTAPSAIVLAANIMP